MILLFLTLDLLIYNLTTFNTYFFLAAFPWGKKENIPIIIIAALILDLFYFNTFPIHLIIFIMIYLLNKLLFKKQNFLKYIYLTTLNFILYISLTYLATNYQNLEIIYLLKFILINYLVNIIFYLLIFPILKKIPKTQNK